MKLYIANGTYVGTQADAKKIDRHYTPVDVPVDKEGLINFLNALVVPPPNSVEDYSADAADLIGDPDDEDYGSAAPSRPMDATSIVARIDGGGDVDAVAETICKARGYPLKRYAASVAQALIEASEGRK